MNIGNKKLAGFSMIEALLAGSLLALLVFTLASVLIFGQESSRISGDRQRAAALAEEGLEVARNMSESSFSSLSAGSHGLAISGNKWIFSGTQDASEIFTRTLIVSDVDSYTKAVTSTVSWVASPQRTGSISLTGRFTNWRRAATSNWASTTVEAAYSPSNTTNGVRVRVDGDYAYVALSSGTNNFLVINIANPASPSLVGQTTVTGTITDMEVSGNYVYLSTTNDTGELTIVNVTTKTAPAVVGYYNAYSTNNGLSVDVIGTTVYLGRVYSTAKNAGEFYIINASNPSAPVFLGGADLSYSIYDVQVSSDWYAYLVTDSNSSEFWIIDVISPSSMILADTVDIVGSNTALNASAIAIFDSNANGIEDMAVVARAGEGRIWMINASSPTNSTLVLANGYTVTPVGTANINHLDVFNANKYLALATSAATAEEVIVDITTPASPTLLSSTNIAGSSNFAAMGLAYAAGVDRLLLVGTRLSANANYVLEIIKPN